MQPILVLTSTYPRWDGDSEPAFVHLLCRQLTRDYRVVVLAPHFPGASRHEIIDGIEVYRFRYFFPFAEHLAYQGGVMTNIRRNYLKLLLVPPFVISQLVNAIKLCRQYNVQLIHAHWLIPQGLIALLTRYFLRRRIPILSTSHGADLFSLQHGMLERLKRLVVQRSERVTVVSSAMQRRLIETGCDSPNISILSMGVDLQNEFIPGTTDASPTDLVCVGRLVEKKGISTLLAALSKLTAEFPRLRLTIVGDGPEKKTLEQLAGQLGISGQVHFTGGLPNKEVPDYYRAARIAIVPSIIARDGDQEGLGLVAVEALGCGCATIVSDLPALRDVVTDGENGLVFRSGDAADLASQIRKLLTDPCLLSGLIERGRPSVISKFDWQPVGAGYRTLIESLITP